MTHDDERTVTLRSIQWSKIIDGLGQRAETWERTARALRGEGGLVELECHDPEEADAIALSYRKIADDIQRQVYGSA